MNKYYYRGWKLSYNQAYIAFKNGALLGARSRVGIERKIDDVENKISIEKRLTNN